MSHVSSSRKLVRSSAIMASGTLISRALGVLRVILITFILGTATRQSDILALATMVPNSLYILFVGGALNTVLVPQIVRHINGDEDRGEAYTNRIMTAFMLIVTVVAIVATFAAPLVARLYSSSDWRAPELADQFASMVMLTYLTLPQIFFYGAFFLLGQILNARDKFGPMMWAPIANNLVSIATLSVYFLVWGNDNDHSLAFTGAQLLLLGLGSTAGIAVQTLVLLFAVRRLDFRLRPRFDFKDTGLGHTFSLTKWTLGFVAVNQLALMIVNRLATSATATGHGAGANVYANAHLIWILPHSLITVSLATAMLPNASRLAAAKKMGDVATEMTKTIRMALIVIVPAAAAFIALAGPISGLLFGHGAGAADAGMIAWTLIAFSVGMIPFTVQFVCLRTYYALEDTRTPFFLQLLIAGINAGGAVLLVWAVNSPSFVAAALALAYSLAYAVGVFASWHVLKGQLPQLNGGALALHTARLLTGAALGGAAAYYLSMFILQLIPHNVWGNLVAGLAGGILILGLYWLVGRLLNVSELRDVAQLLRSRFGKRPEAAADQSPAAQDEVSERLNEMTMTQNAVSGGQSGSAMLAEDHVPTAVTPKLTDAEIRRRDAEGADPATRSRGVWGLWNDDTSPYSPSPPEDDEETTGSGFDPFVTPARAVGAPLIPPPQPSPDDDDDEPSVSIGDLFRPVLPPIADDGTILHARYQLTELLTERDHSETWRAHDQVLSRDVVVHAMRKDDPQADELMAAARRGAIATESRFLRILDAGILDDPDLRIGAYVVCEYAPGKSLTQVLRSGPLSAIEAGWVVRELADALAGVHSQGQFHERLTPDTVVITTSGTVRVVGFGVESALEPSAGERAWSERERADIEALGTLLYAMLVHRWPQGNRYGLKAAPQVGGRVAAPSELRTGISPALDRVCMTAMSGQGFHTARDLARALTEFLGTADASVDLEDRVRRPAKPAVSIAEPAIETETVVGPPLLVRPVAGTGAGAASPLRARPDEERRPAAPTRAFPGERSEPTMTVAHEPPKSRQRVMVVAIVAIAFVVLSIALLIGALNSARNDDSEAAGTPTTSLSPSPSVAESPTPAAEPGPLAIASVRDFDPEADGGNDEENPDQVGNVLDGDPSTGWETMRYLNHPTLGNLKPGVGIVVDLGQPREVSTVDLTLGGGGGPTAVELRVPAGDTASMATQEDWTVVATRADTPTGKTTFTLTEPVTTQYLLVYLTELPEMEDGTGYRGVITEIAVGGR
ncbi:MAG TPA: murein biosynthesis integral membrane protein MurJ [Arachnia sp.]|nr:murein biosynthesis integral membrane protein MurJ [Arachnia sp.]HMT85986.1 murein biosynthesis integral membrane protein MurJ [Arachnia sp.]